MMIGNEWQNWWINSSIEPTRNPSVNRWIGKCTVGYFAHDDDDDDDGDGIEIHACYLDCSMQSAKPFPRSLSLTHTQTLTHTLLSNTGLTDYPQIIKHPMDLGTIRTRLKKGNHYKTLYQVAEDVRLVWQNCMTYNADGSDFYKLAQSLQKRWDERYTKLLNECQAKQTPAASGGSKTANAAAVSNAASSNGAGTAAAGTTTTAATTTPANVTSGSTGGGAFTSSEKVSLQERREFAKSLYSLSKEDLGKVLVEVDAKCPAALVRNASEDEIEFNIDKIPASVLQELTRFVKSTAANATTTTNTTGNTKTTKKKAPPSTTSTNNTTKEQQPNSTSLTASSGLGHTSSMAGPLKKAKTGTSSKKE